MTYDDFKKLNNFIKGNVPIGRIVSKIWVDLRYCQVEVRNGVYKNIDLESLIEHIKNGDLCISNPSILKQWA